MPAISDLASTLTGPSPRWMPAEAADSDVVAHLSHQLGLPRVICQLLARRGYGDVERAKRFLKPTRTEIHPPGELAGMDAAATRIARAISGREIVLVHGDYDVDGMCSTALLTRAFRMMGGRVVPFVPHRVTDGYDLTAAGVAAATRAGARLIVTADCGIVAHAAVASARLAGIDVVVTDHHTPSATLPAALAVVNPNRRDCTYPDKGLAGAGVAYKLALAVAQELGFAEERLHSLLDLVAVASIADLAPVTGENRALLRWGIKVLQRTPNAGLRALLRSSGLGDQEEITAGQIGFILAPRLNAAGRLGDAMRGVRLLLTDDKAEAEQLALELESENRRRRELDTETLADALRMLDRQYDPSRDVGVVLASAEWHPGIIGIVASRVVEVIHRPTVLIALGGDEGKGSARSIRGMHLYDAFAACSRHLIRFGGHRAAAGCSLLPSNVEAFREAFNEAARRALTPDQLVPEISLDGDLSLSEATGDLYRLLRHFAPFGIGNPTPVFSTRRATIAVAPRVVGGKHLKLTLGGGDRPLSAIGFGMAGRLDQIGEAGAEVDVAFKLEENSWRDRTGRQRAPELQARIVDFRRTG